LIAARASLRALDDVHDPGTVILLPNSREVPREEAASSLAALPKPVWCLSSIMKGRLALHCVPIPEDPVAGTDSVRRHTSDFVQGWVHENLGKIHPGSPVQVEGPGNRAIVRYESFQRWIEEYDGDWAFGLDRRDPDGGIAFVVTFAPSDVTVTFIPR
jgi:hypothetical protein